jgi:hypothetical protein
LCKAAAKKKEYDWYVYFLIHRFDLFSVNR